MEEEKEESMEGEMTRWLWWCRMEDEGGTAHEGGGGCDGEDRRGAIAQRIEEERRMDEEHGVGSGGCGGEDGGAAAWKIKEE